MGPRREASGNFAMVSEKKQRCLHAPWGNWGGQPVRDLMLEGGYERGREGGEIVRGPGHVPCAVQKEPHPGPSSDVRVSWGAAVGEHVVGELDRVLMKLMESPDAALAARTAAEAEGSEPAAVRRRFRSLLSISECSFCQRISTKPILGPVELWGRRKGLVTVRDQRPRGGRRSRDRIGCDGYGCDPRKGLTIVLRRRRARQLA